MLEIKSPLLRKIISVAVPFVLAPATVLLGATVFGAKSYAYVSTVLALLAVALFIAGFEKKKIGTRRLIIVAVMSALCVVGRMLPVIKPVTALTVLAALYLGSESGFLVGAISALLSNFYFGQGPWTPFQMLAWGLIGLFAGFLAEPLKKSRVLLLVFGFLSGAIFSLLMDVWSVLWFSGGFNLELYATALVTSLPHTAIYAVSNCVFLWLLAKPFGDKLGRIKLKYGI